MGASAENIEMLMALGATRDQATKLLDDTGNNLERAANLFLDPPAVEAASAWSSSNGSDGWGQPHFRIDAPDNTQLLQPDNLPPAPSRPSSRSSTRVDTVDLTNDDDGWKASTNEQQELAAACAMSLADQGWGGSQEMGVTDKSGTIYGPMTQTHYSSNMAMTPYVRTTAHEITLNPDPPARKREPGEPAFLRPSNRTDSLSALITILHKIPLARKALLFEDLTLADYGYHDSWWDGENIALADEIRSDGSMHLEQLLLAEVQRLVAFLDMTERAYGSTDFLGKIVGDFEKINDDILGHFISVWTEAAFKFSGGHFPLADVFSSIARLQQAEQYFNNLVVASDAQSGPSLYDRIDRIVWAEEAEGRSLKSIGEVFCIQLMPSTSGYPFSGMNVPATMYLDRYLEKNQDLLVQKRQERSQWFTKLRELELKKNHLRSFKHPRYPSRTFDPLKLIESAAACFDRESESRDGVDAMETDLSPADQKVVEHLRSAYDRLLQSIDGLEKEEHSYQLAIDEYPTILTNPEAADPAHRPAHKYRLMGVSMEPGIVYVRCPVDPSDETGNTPDATSSGMQWWRLKFSSAAIASIEKEKVPEPLVLKAARADTYAGLLVYASDKAMAPVEEAPLSEALKMFVTLDNEAFDHELNPGANTVVHSKPQRLQPEEPETPSTDTEVDPSRRSPKRKASTAEPEPIEIARQRTSSSSRSTDEKGPETGGGPFGYGSPNRPQPVARISARPAGPEMKERPHSLIPASSHAESGKSDDPFELPDDSPVKEKDAMEGVEHVEQA